MGGGDALQRAEAGEARPQNGRASYEPASQPCRGPTASPGHGVTRNGASAPASPPLPRDSGSNVSRNTSDCSQIGLRPAWLRDERPLSGAESA